MKTDVVLVLSLDRHQFPESKGAIYMIWKVQFVRYDVNHFIFLVK